MSALTKKPLTMFYILIGCAAALTLIGLIMVFSASSIHSLETKGTTWGIFIRQLIFAVAAIPLAYAVAGIKASMWSSVARLGLPLSIVLLLLVHVPGLKKTVNGNTNWISLGPVDVQPSELVKFLIIIWGAAMLARYERAGILNVNVMKLLLPGFLIVMALIMSGKDLGTAAVIAVILGGMLFVSGIHLQWIVVAIISGSMALGFFIVTASYRIQRFLVVLNPFAPDDYKNAGWQPAHSLLGLASGGFFGVGLGASRQKWGNLAEAHTDFIFSVIGEELGLFGTLGVLALLTGLVFAIFHIAIRARDPFSRFACAGIGTWMAIQIILNIGSAISVLPVVGVTLPLVSYGGSALISTYIALGFVAGVALRDPAVREGLKERHL